MVKVVGIARTKLQGLNGKGRRNSKTELQGLNARTELQGLNCKDWIARTGLQGLNCKD